MADFKKKGFGGRPSFGGARGGDRGGRGGFGGGGNRFGGGNKFGGAPGRSQMFIVTCAQCHKSCEVPFRPNGMKPVYCNDCFGSKGGPSRDSRDFGSTTFPRDPERAPQAGNTALNDIKTALSMVNIKIDKILAILNQVEVVEEGGDRDSSISEDIASLSSEPKKKKAAGKRK